MPAMRNKRMRHFAVLLLPLLIAPVPALAHPMPDTEIAVAYKEDGIGLTIHVSLSDLILAVPASARLLDGPLTQSERESLASYFSEHIGIVTTSGSPLSVSIDNIRLERSEDAEVGHYEEVEVEASAAAVSGQDLILHYDGVLHQVANHRAIVRYADGTVIGIIRFSLAEKRAIPLKLHAP